ncbi:transposase [Abditibacterium utsteinense]|uniref:transposase n=1 Tax=Abditibacterium utsteinense TaxID=1960156 RepID=UPI001EE695D6|nr:transposase [Abditibacterium utsteinense]
MRLCDMAGNFLDALVLPADMDERTCALALLVHIQHKSWRANIEVVFADQGFEGKGFEAQIQQQCGLTLEIVRRDPNAPPGFTVLSKRWLIEQVFGCWGRNRRLCRDYEQNPKMSRATLQAASVHRFLRRLKPISHEFSPFKYKPK